MTIAEHIKQMQEYPPDWPVAVDVWLPADIKAEAHDMRVLLTDEEVAAVMTDIQDNDPSVGINWTIVRHAIGKVVGKRSK